MNISRRAFLEGAALLAGSLTLVGCSGDEISSGSSTNSAATTASTVTTDSIKKAGKLVVGGEMNYEPYEYLGDDGQYTGYDIEIWHRVADDLGVDLEIVDVPFSGALTGLDAGRYDVVGCVVGVNADRAKSYLFCSPVKAAVTCVVKAIGNDAIQSVDDLNGKTVGVQTGSSAELSVENWDEEQRAAGKAGVTINGYTGTTDAFMDVANGGIDAAAEDDLMVKQLMDNNPDTYEVVGEIGDHRYLAYAFKLSDSEFRDYVNSELQAMKDDGTVGELQMKYFGEDDSADLPTDESEFIPQ